jgi:hypothetical protein
LSEITESTKHAKPKLPSTRKYYSKHAANDCKRETRYNHAMSETVKLSTLIPDGKNANLGSPRGNQMIEDSLRQYGAGRSILLDKHGNIVAGNKTVENAAAIGMDDVIVVQSDGTKLVAVQRTDLDLADPHTRQLAIADNRSSQVSLDWDTETLKGLVDDGVDLAPFWTADELAAMWPQDGAGDGNASQTLAERFGVPPFSVLDARQGYWQERKKAWLSLGIQSEVGRGGGNLGRQSGSDGVRIELLPQSAAPGGSARPACDYSKHKRGDGRGRPISGGGADLSKSGAVAAHGKGGCKAQFMRDRGYA